MSLNSLTKLLVIILLPLLFTAVSCNKPTEPPPPEKYDLEIIAADASCTEVWIDVKTPNTLLPQIFTLTENGEEKGSVKIDKADTTIVIENLLPKKSYKYQLNNNEHKSNETEITTLDTTSHNFTWQTFEFGEYGNSLIWDVAIIDENNIWAVGEIYMNDANGNPDPQSYNAVHWDGTKWELKKIGNQGGWACHTVFAFSAIDIWFEGTINWDGSNYTVHQNGWPLMPNGDGWRINKMWGSSRNDLYAVGNGGNIAHWNGSSWRKMESGTEVDLLDVYGTPDGKTIWACGYSGDYAVTVLLRYNGNTWSKVYEGSPNNQNNNEYIGPISGVWTKSKYFSYVTNWAFIYTQPNQSTLHIKRITPWYGDVAFTISGTNYNNIFIAGQGGLVGHYNGNTYKELIQIKDNNTDIYGIDSRDGLTVAVGTKMSNVLFYYKAVLHLINKQ